MAQGSNELLAKLLENLGSALHENAKLLRAAPPLDASASSARGKKRKRGDAKKPRGTSAYNFFVANQFAEAKNRGEPARPQKESMEVFGDKWKALSEEQKAPFVAMAAKSKADAQAAASAGALPAPGAAGSSATPGSQATVPATPHSEAAEKKKKKKKDKEEKKKKKKDKEKQSGAAVVPLASV